MVYDVLRIAQCVQEGVNLLSSVWHAYEGETFIQLCAIFLRQVEHRSEDIGMGAQQ